MEPIPMISYSDFILILLTTLAVMLGILAIGMAVLAIWGYSGFKEFVREAARVHVAEAMAIKMKEYPDGAKVLESMKQLKDRADILEGIQNQLVTQPQSKPVASASNTEVQVIPIAQYPGEEEEKNASSTGENIPESQSSTDPRSDNS